MASHVNHEAASLGEAFGTVLAYVRFFARVHSDVLDQDRLFGEAFAAILAAKMEKSALIGDYSIDKEQTPCKKLNGKIQVHYTLV